MTFFTEDAKQAIITYLDIYRRDNRFVHLFTKSQCIMALKKAPIQVKDLRKFFSQDWDRRGGSTSVKKLLMGHSVRNDVDLSHYNTQSPEDLKKIYDKIMDMSDFKV